MTTPIASLSIAARATLNMHSLNNEGGEGNQIQTRMVEIVDHKGELHSVNAISGDMLKHILMEHFYQLARDREVALCESCQRFNANRINADRGFIAETAKTNDSQFINQVLARCAIDDVAGILVTEGGRSIPRKSISEFGWVIGLPDKTRTESYLHVKYVSERGKEKRDDDAAGQKSGSNLGQSLFHRPASSGIYALVCHLELARIGYNDILQKYAIDNDERHKRSSLLLESLLHTFIELNGAMRSSQLPHLVTLEGVITTSTGVIPAPLVSPLLESDDDDADNKTYQKQIEGIVSALNGNGEQVVKMHAFNSISEFAALLRSFIDTSSPFKLAVER
jgi:CRISPR-associated protein Cst2